MKNKGIIAINKPQNWTSFDVVNKIKYQLKPLKVGHLGTLDPMATGVLLVTVGKATKLFDIMQEKVKTYVAEFEFGYETDTLDATGQIKSKTNNIPSMEDIEQVTNKFVGEIDQIPPKYSAKSINGKRAYELARNSIDFEIKPKKVTIYEINLISYENRILRLEIKCGSGTYIRSIARDLAYELNSLATMISLVRTSVGAIDLSKTISISKDTQREELENEIMDISQVLNLDKLRQSDITTAKILNGQTVDLNHKDGDYCLMKEEDVAAIVKIVNNKAKMSIFLD